MEELNKLQDSFRELSREISFLIYCLSEKVLPLLDRFNDNEYSKSLNSNISKLTQYHDIFSRIAGIDIQKDKESIYYR